MARCRYNIKQFRRSEWVIRAPTTGQHQGCTLVDVAIAYRDETTILGNIPCFSCSGFTRFQDFYAYAEEWLTGAIYQHHFPHVRQRRATRVAEDVIFSVLGDDRFDCAGPFTASTVHVVDIKIWPRMDAAEFDVDRAISESFEEAEPGARPATLDSLIGLYTVRCEQESKEELERSWSDSEHECVICMDGIEKLCESLTMPCSHVFHENCLKRWLDNNYVCPLCRYEMPSDLET